MLFASASVSISCALQPFSKLPVPTALLFGFNSLCSDRGRCAGQSAPVRQQLCNQFCNSRPTTAYNMPTFWHTQAAMPFQHPAHEFQDLFECFVRMDAARSFDNIFPFRPSTSVATAGARAVVRSAALHELRRSRADRWLALDRLCAAQ